jgi:hypothetical protein
VERPIKKKRARASDYRCAALDRALDTCPISFRLPNSIPAHYTNPIAAGGELYKPVAEVLVFVLRLSGRFR